jgi:hypothetical protein
MLNEYLQNFKNSINSPTIKMLYKLKWAQLEQHVETKNLKILDFGSGFGVHPRARRNCEGVFAHT